MFSVGRAYRTVRTATPHRHAISCSTRGDPCENKYRAKVPDNSSAFMKIFPVFPLNISLTKPEYFLIIYNGDITGLILYPNKLAIFSGISRLHQTRRTA